MEIRQLRYFLCIAELRNISKSSERLHVAQPALSRQMRQLEDELGVPLFVRGARGVELTEGGLALVPMAAEVIERTEIIAASFRVRSRARAHNLTIGMPEALGRATLPRILDRFKAHYPDAVLHVKVGFSATIRKWILDSEVDVGILYAPPLYEPLMEIQPLFSESLVLIGPGAEAQCLRGFAPPGAIEFAQLACMPLILANLENGVRRTLDRVASDIGITLKPIMEVDNFSLLTEMVLQGRGFTVLTASSVNDELKAGRLRAWQIKSPSVELTIAMATLKIRQPSRPTDTLIDILLQDLREAPTMLSRT
ncbi:MAG: LysR family transcriptional regulator [Pseudomonadota bacterium]